MNFSYLNYWLEREIPLPPFANLESQVAYFEYGGFLSLQKSFLLHDAANHKQKSLNTAWKETREYLENALEIARYGEMSSSWLDREEADMIIAELGLPKETSFPIYFVTVGKDDSERLVYIGKTSSDTNRFTGGHKVALKLHHPMYSGLEKKIYLCWVSLLTEDKKMLPLEWINPLETSLKILDSVESELINYFKPELNISKKRKNYSNHPISLYIQNHSSISNFLNDVFVS